MACYVDNAEYHYRRMIMCHMTADTEAELHAMANKIGIPRKWYQNLHYDICRAKRRLAIENGAISISRRDLANMVGKKRRGSLPSEVII